MGKGLTLTTDIKQQQRLTPLQVQFVRMLEMTGPEVEDEVQRALDEMPALEAVDENSRTDHNPDDTEDGERFNESSEDMQRADFTSDDEVPDYLTGTSTTSKTQSDDGYNFDAPYASRNYTGDDTFEPIIANSGETLIDSLTNQLSELSLNEESTHIAHYIIGSIDDNGYMTRSLEALADDMAINEGISAPLQRIKEVWQTIRQMEPAGIGAVDLRDCMILQLQRLPRTAASLTALEVITNYFDLFSKKHFDKIASAIGINRDQLNDAITTITHLNPKPGSVLMSSVMDDTSRHIIPDFSVEADDNGNLKLTLLNRIPELRIEASFASDSFITDAGKRNEDAQIFVRRKREDARNFIKVISLRQETLFSVMSAILKLQHRFFITEADEDIRPMVLRDIAALTGYDLSVVSRAAQGKYVATIRGLYPLKKFFNEKIRDDNDMVTANRVIAEIRKAINNEDSNNPLSDREITDLLAQAGYDIARRTVAKYRESLGFPVARLRKK